MSEPTRGGPGKMTPEQLADFLAVPRWASLCVGGPEGTLEVAPVWIWSATGRTVELESPADRPHDAPPALACVVADEFESYAGIRGAILRGVLTAPPGGDPEGRSRETFVVTRALGFSFEGSTTSL